MCAVAWPPRPQGLAAVSAASLGPRRDSDSDILLRRPRRNQRVRWLPTRVHYPADGLSHFRLFRDNVRISAMHTRLFFGMLVRAPMILWRRWQA